MQDTGSAILEAGRHVAAFEIVEAHLANLPEPVRRYLLLAGVVGRKNIRTVHLRQKGLFRLKPEGKWLPFAAEQWFGTEAPEFLWAARIRFLPFLNIVATDRFTGGHGRLVAQLFSFKMADAAGPEVDHGELLRYLAEIVWFPTAWISPHIDWEGVDAKTAKATLNLPGISASMLLHFDEFGRLATFSTQRYMTEGGRFLLRDWGGQCGDYQRVDGLLIPMKASVMWRLATGDFEYFRGEITEIAYDV
jgi:hypothetical protein